MLVLGALGDSLLGEAIADALALPRDTARQLAADRLRHRIEHDADLRIAAACIAQVAGAGGDHVHPHAALGSAGLAGTFPGIVMAQGSALETKAAKLGFTRAVIPRGNLPKTAIDGIERRLASLKNRHYSVALRSLDDRRRAYHEQQSDLGGYVASLVAVAPAGMATLGWPPKVSTRSVPTASNSAASSPRTSPRRPSSARCAA